MLELITNESRLPAELRDQGVQSVDLRAVDRLRPPEDLPVELLVDIDPAVGDLNSITWAMGRKCTPC